MKTVVTQRMDCLDGLRGLLAFYVLLGHMAPFAALPDWLQDAVSHGGAAVDLFFVLSGLVITQSLLHAHRLATPFLIARVTRIFPVFLVMFLIAVIIQPWSCGFEHMPWIGADNTARTICGAEWPRAWLPEIVAHLTMTHGLFPTTILPTVWVSFLGSAWSLSTEWQFYLLILFAANRSPRLCWILLGLALAGVAWHLLASEAWQFSRAFLPNKGHFFALGVASVPVVRRESGAMGRYALVLAASLAICATQGTLSKLLTPMAWTIVLAVQTQPEMLGLRTIGTLLQSHGARGLGGISYCLYLVNEPIHKLIAPALGRLADGNSTVFTVLWVPLAIGLPVLAAIWLHVRLETPVLQWGRTIADRFEVAHAAPSGQVRAPGL